MRDEYLFTEYSAIAEYYNGQKGKQCLKKSF